MRNDKWTYKVITLKVKSFAKADVQAEHMEEQLNQLGMIGWELINVVAIGASMKAFLKR